MNYESRNKAPKFKKLAASKNILANEAVVNLETFERKNVDVRKDDI